MTGCEASAKPVQLFLRSIPMAGFIRCVRLPGLFLQLRLSFGL